MEKHVSMCKIKYLVVIQIFLDQGLHLTNYINKLLSSRIFSSFVENLNCNNIPLYDPRIILHSGLFKSTNCFGLQEILFPFVDFSKSMQIYQRCWILGRSKRKWSAKFSFIFLRLGSWPFLSMPESKSLT
jgi:hypothetical protein